MQIGQKEELKCHSQRARRRRYINKKFTTLVRGELFNWLAIPGLLVKTVPSLDHRAIITFKPDKLQDSFSSATPGGTVGNCGKYCEVMKEDSCDVIALANGFTFTDFQVTSPYFNSMCSNLLTDCSYCVAIIDGITVTTTTAATQTTVVTAPTSTILGRASQFY
jgi:hypothetical protein